MRVGQWRINITVKSDGELVVTIEPLLRTGRIRAD
jgi:hypothetical protein